MYEALIVSSLGKAMRGLVGISLLPRPPLFLFDPLTTWHGLQRC